MNLVHFLSILLEILVLEIGTVFQPQLQRCQTQKSFIVLLSTSVKSYE